MAVRYIAGTEDVGQLVNLPFDQEDSWWSGVSRNFASVALATALAATVLSTAVSTTVATSWQDELATPTFQPDEDYQQNLVLPVQATQYQVLPYLYDDVADATPVKDEDFWQNPVAPVPASGYLFQQYGQEPDFVPFFPDEDFWANPVPPVQASMWQTLPLGNEQDWTPFTPDEDFWQNPTPPVAASLYQSLPYGFDEAIWTTIPPLPGDEDFFWANLFPAPVQATMYVALPFNEDANLIAENVVASGNQDVEIHLNKLNCVLQPLNQL